MQAGKLDPECVNPKPVSGGWVVSEYLLVIEPEYLNRSPSRLFIIATNFISLFHYLFDRPLKILIEYIYLKNLFNYSGIDKYRRRTSL